MPGLSVEVNGIRIATIGLAGLDVVDVSVHGALDREQKATLGAHGGNYAEGGCGHLIWIDERALLPGDVVRISLHDTCGPADRGKTIAELYPDEEPSTKTDFSISEETAAEIRARPRLHEAFLVRVETSTGQAAAASSDERNTDFRFSVFWDRYSPDRARLRLSTCCLDDVLARTGGTEHLRSTIAVGESASFVLLP